MDISATIETQVDYDHLQAVLQEHLAPEQYELNEYVCEQYDQGATTYRLFQVAIAYVSLPKLRNFMLQLLKANRSAKIVLGQSPSVEVSNVEDFDAAVDAYRRLREIDSASANPNLLPRDDSKNQGKPSGL